MSGAIPFKTHIGSKPHVVNIIQPQIVTAALPAQRRYSGRIIGRALSGHHRSFSWPRHNTSQRHLLTITTAAITATSTAGSFPENNKTATASTNADKGRSSVRLASELLWPDRALVALTAVTLILTVGLTLAFPLAIGDIFDVVRENLASTTATVGAATGTLTPPTTTLGLTQTIADVQGIVANAPPKFYPTLLRLSACLILSAAGNAAVAFLAPLLGERFAVRLRKRLMLETLSKDQAFFDSAGKGDIVSLLTLDVAVIQNTLADFLGQRGIRSMLEVFCSLAIM